MDLADVALELLGHLGRRPRTVLRSATTPHRGLLTALAVVLALGSGVLIGSSAPTIPLAQVAIVAFLLQILSAYLLTFHIALKPMSLIGLTSLIWVIFFPMRLAVITFSRPSIYYYDAVNTLPEDRMAWVWILLTGAFVSFTVAAAISRRRTKRVIVKRPEQLSYNQFLSFACIGLAITAISQLLGINSGLVSNIGAFALFGIAGASFLEIKNFRPPRHISACLTLVSVILGYTTGFKEAALLPVAAWIIGRIAGGQHLRTLYLVVCAIAVPFAFAAVQGQRAATSLGLDLSPIEASKAGLTQIDLASGEPRDSKGLSIISNVVGGTLFRLKGADFFVVITERVPEAVPFQRGRSLWQPALSVIPGSNLVVNLNPQYRQLSLGRFVTTTLTSPEQTSNASSQSMTYPGDFYLNFGPWGVIVGMMVLGWLFQTFDFFSYGRGASTAGLLAFIGLGLVAVDRNVAYVLVTATIRIAILVGVLMLLQWNRVARPTEEVSCGAAR